jgi:hypothetical protein
MTFLSTLFSPAGRKAQVAVVTSVAGLAAVFGLTDPDLVASILAGIAGIGNVVAVYAATNTDG